MSDSDLPLGQEFELEPTTATSSNTNTDEAEEESSDMEMGVMDNSPREERTSITGSAEPRISEESSRSSEDGEDVEEAGKPNYNNLNRVTEMATKVTPPPFLLWCSHITVSFRHHCEFSVSLF